MRKRKSTRREYGTGTIIRNESIQRYTVRWTDNAGQRHSNSTFPLTVEGRKTAQAFMKEVNAQLAAGIVAASRYTVGKLIVDYLEVKKIKIKRQSLRNYCNAAKYFKTIEHIQLQKLKSSDVQSVYSLMLGKGLKSTTIWRTHAVIQGAIKYALRQRLLAYDPLLAVEVPGGRKNRRTETFSRRDFGRMFLHIDRRTWWKPYNYPLLFRLLAQTGARVGEIAALKWIDIDWKKREIHIQRTVDGSDVTSPKSESGNRKVPIIFDKTYEMLRNEHESRPQDCWVFQSRGGLHIHYTTIRRVFSGIREAAGISKTKCMHTYRHTWATVALAKGIPAMEVSRILGHHRTSMTIDIYGHAIEGYNQVLIEMFKPNKKF